MCGQLNFTLCSIEVGSLPTQIAITLNICTSRSKIRKNFTDEIEEERLDFDDTIYTCFSTFLSFESKTKMKFYTQLFYN